MKVDVQNGNAIARHERLCGNRRVVEVAEAPVHRTFGMVTGRAAQRIDKDGSCRDQIGAGERTVRRFACGNQRVAGERREVSIQ